MKSFIFRPFSITYNVNSTNVICISMPHRLNVFFLHFFMKVNFLVFEKKFKEILTIKITAIFFQFVVNILYYRLYDVQRW